MYVLGADESTFSFVLLHTCLCMIIRNSRVTLRFFFPLYNCYTFTSTVVPVWNSMKLHLCPPDGRVTNTGLPPTLTASRSTQRA